MKKAQIIMASCDRRSLEVEQAKNFLLGNGYSIIDETRLSFTREESFKVSKDADLILNSTCAFTTPAEDIAIKYLNRIQKEKKASAKIIVCGCLPEINSDRLAKMFDGDNFGPRSFERLDEILEPRKKFREFPRPNTLQINRSLKTRLTVLLRDSKVVASEGGLEALVHMVTKLGKSIVLQGISEVTGHDKRFYIQIQEGCPCKCSFCAIRFAIKGLKSKPVDDVIGEFQKGLEQGYKKFLFLGDSSGAYGLDIGENMGNLLRRVLEIDRDFSLELTDISPVYLHLFFNEIKELSAKGKISELYVPTQSGNPRILKLMQRSCDIDHVKGMLLELKSISSIKLITSIIVGFPSETREELNDTIEFCEQVGFDWVSCHIFSARPETIAATLPGQLSLEEKSERLRLVKSKLHNKTKLITDADARPHRATYGVERIL